MALENHLEDIYLDKHHHYNEERISKQLQHDKELPSEWFEPIDFVTFMHWKMDGWEMPTEYHCMIRARNHRTNKVTEHVYKSGAAAKKKVKELIAGAETEFTVCTHNDIQHLIPLKYVTDNDKENYSV